MSEYMATTSKKKTLAQEADQNANDVISNYFTHLLLRYDIAQ